MKIVRLLLDKEIDTKKVRKIDKIFDKSQSDNILFSFFLSIQEKVVQSWTLGMHLRFLCLKNYHTKYRFHFYNMLILKLHKTIRVVMI